MRWAGFVLSLLLLTVFYPILPSALVLGAIGGMILIPLISWGLMWAVRGYVRLELAAPATGQKRSEIPVTIRVLNKTALPIGRLEMNVTVSNSITGQKEKKKMVCSGSGGWNITSDYCGCLDIRAENVRLYDLFGLLWVRVPAPKEKRVVVMPDTFPVLIQQDMHPAPADDCQDYAPNRKGQDRTETYQIRDYVPGDSLAQIHWKLSSKWGDLVVRDPGLPMDQNLMVFVDRSWGDVTSEQADSIMEAAVSVCQSLCEAGAPFQLVWNEETIHVEYVTDQDMLPGAVSALLKSRQSPKALPGTDVYLGLYGAARVSRIVYMGTRIPDSLEELASQSRLVSLLCADGDDQEGVVYFAPENCEDVLAQVSWS